VSGYDLGLGLELGLGVRVIVRIMVKVRVRVLGTSVFVFYLCLSPLSLSFVFCLACCPCPCIFSLCPCLRLYLVSLILNLGFVPWSRTSVSPFGHFLHFKLCVGGNRRSSACGGIRAICCAQIKAKDAVARRSYFEAPAHNARAST
jgi:hypothetical protein